MSQSLVQNYIHIVFSTKYRDPLILPKYEKEIHTYLGGICKQLNCTPIIVGGYVDHIHILCMLSRDITLIELVKKVKGNSSKWIKSLGPELSNFYWQDGYACFSVDKGRVASLKKYIQNQKQHHDAKKLTFETELINILEKNRVEYSKKYLFD